MSQRVHPVQEEAEQLEQAFVEEDEAFVVAPVLKVLRSRSGRAQSHSGQGGFLAREFRSSSSNRW